MLRMPGVWKMEASCFCHRITYGIRTPLIPHGVGNPSPERCQVAFPVKKLAFPSRGVGMRICRDLAAAVVSPAAQLEEETVPLELVRPGGSCGERKGLVEMLECLEREAIMGDDEGKEPKDYNRRAQIFDRSSKVFQALKEADGCNNTSTIGSSS